VASPSRQSRLRGLHGLYWLVANLAEQDRLVLVLDDAHWADEPSLRLRAARVWRGPLAAA